MPNAIFSKILFKKTVVNLAMIFWCLLAVGFTPAQTTENLSLTDRVEIFEKVWDKIKEKYYDPNLNGVNWNEVKAKYRPQVETSANNSEFYRLMKQMVGEMKDSHTRFLTPREASERRKRQSTSVGLVLDEVDGKIVILRVLPKTEAENAKLKPGMILVSIDGQTIEERIAALSEEVGTSSSDRAAKILLYRRLLEGEPETTVNLRLIDENQNEITVNLKRRVLSHQPKVSSQILPSGIGYISINRFLSPVSEMFRQELENVKDTPGLIIDLRFNGGGEMFEVLRIAGLLTEKRTSFGKVFSRSDKQSEIWSSDKNPQLYKASIVILVNEFSASGSELLASGLQEANRAKIVGTQSCGCLLGISEQRQLKGGAELHISEIGFISAKGKVYERTGVSPDKTISLKIADIQKGYDSGLIEAEKMLKSQNGER